RKLEFERERGGASPSGLVDRKLELDHRADRNRLRLVLPAAHGRHDVVVGAGNALDDADLVHAAALVNANFYHRHRFARALALNLDDVRQVRHLARQLLLLEHVRRNVLRLRCDAGATDDATDDTALDAAGDAALDTALFAVILV